MMRLGSRAKHVVVRVPLWLAAATALWGGSCGSRTGPLDAGGQATHHVPGPSQGGSDGRDAGLVVPGSGGMVGGTGGGAAGGPSAGGSSGVGGGGLGGSTASGGSGASGPNSCDDVGTFPGTSTCCEGKYCSGFCKQSNFCICGTNIGGCIWPEVCCGGACKGPYAKSCTGAWEMESTSFVEVNEGTACLPPPLGPGYELVQRSCCNGKLCEGRCLLFEGKTKPECWCVGLPGGCPSPHVCCKDIHCSTLSGCNLGGH